ncbi:hypothetical protein [Bradyrhizobium sp. SZCCHNR3118]|uniref:hypothetical protein n=1 Tax=Bradyrhizobium sp. SZCCHNR3118 TaxID=3057468 RepID=UPI0029161C39|nr:hypothetical protein [Bradyrhizobium sp. SZCCHNR3118]
MNNLHRKTVYGYPVIDVIRILEMHGYVVRHKSESRQPLSFHRTVPYPKGVDFRQEALDSIRNQLSLDHIQFEERSPPGIPESLPKTISSAYLRILY